jgi:glycerophosphoryl diester phosphodiesterase
MIRPRRAPLILGHRGFRARFPENTLLAFRMALHHGAEGFECDVQKSADGRYVVIHDASTDRVARQGGAVSGQVLGQLRSLDVGDGQRIPTLEETLDMLPRGAWIDVELKNETLRTRDSGRGTLLRKWSDRRRSVPPFAPFLSGGVGDRLAVKPGESG